MRQYLLISILTSTAYLTSVIIAAALFIDEYSRAGSLVQSIAVPTAQLTADGGNVPGGMFSLSTDNNYIVFAGYARAAGGTIATGDARKFGLVNVINGSVTVDTQSITPPASTTLNPRSVVYDPPSGKVYLTSASTTGTYYWSRGSASAAVQIDSNMNLQLQIMNSVLYASRSSSSGRLASFGGLPTATTSPTSFTGNGARDGFVLFDKSDTLQVVDTVYALTTASSGSVTKYYTTTNSTTAGFTSSSSGTISNPVGISGRVTTANTIEIFVIVQGGSCTHERLFLFFILPVHLITSPAQQILW